MNSQLNNIFRKHDPVTREEMQAYLDGKLSGADLHRVEEKLAGSGFENEALEGLSTDATALSALPLTPSFLNTAPVTGGGSVYKSLFWATAGIAVVTTAITLYVLFGDENKTTLKQDNIAKVEEPVLSAEEIHAEDLREIEDAQPIESTEQITYKKTIANQATTVIDENPVVEIIQPVIEKEVPVIDPKKNEVIEVKEPENKAARSNVKFTYLHDLKVIDYSNLYTTGIQKTELVMNTGTPANLADEHSKPETDMETRTVNIPYEKYLDETLYAFAKNDFKTALKNFKTIHQHYPEDLNAFFYGALCYYNLGKFDKAISYFDKCINNSYSTFEEEAQWYKAMSLLQSRKTEEAKSLLKAIVEGKGFYAAMANAKLKSIEN